MSHIQRYAKTSMAWEALARPDLMGRHAHTLLLMANGRRSVEELSLLLGEDVSASVHDLMQRGYLHATAPVNTRVADDESRIKA